MNKIINQIIKNKTDCFFISPHLDDAALSAGELIRFLSGKTKVTVINLFTVSDTGPQTLSAKKALKDAGFTDSKVFYRDRVKEDQSAFSSIGVKVINLDYKEALWRKVTVVSSFRKLMAKILPELIHVYPTYRLHISSGRVSGNDNQMISEIADKLKKIITKDAKVFCPIGVGNHVDHLVTRMAVEKVLQPIYWLDQPYGIRDEAKSSQTISDFTLSFEYLVNRMKKEQLLKHYKNQINLLFAEQSIPLLKEKFFTKKEAASSLPSKIKDYYLVKEILTQKSPRHFTYGLYQNDRLQKAFAKQWVGEKKNSYFNWLSNEIKVYFFLENLFKKHPDLIRKFPNVYLPKFIAAVQKADQVVLLLEYVEGKPLAQFNQNDKQKIYHKIFNFLSNLNQKIDSKDDLMGRSSWFWTAVMPLVMIKAIIKNPDLVGLVLKSGVIFISKLPYFLFDHKKGFVHRDLGDWNILVNKQKIILYDFQLACLADPILEYVIADLKTWTVGRNSNFFPELMKEAYPFKYNRYNYQMLAICLSIYDLSQTEGGDRKSTVDFLKYQISTKIENRNSLIGNWWKWFKREVYLFWQTPKNYLYMLTLSKEKQVRISTYDPKLEKIAKEVMRKIQSIGPKLKIHFIGSAKLHIIGQKDIDLFIETPANTFDTYLPALSRCFGEPQKRRKLFVEWCFKIEDCTVELSLVDPDDKIFQTRLKVFEAIKTDKILMEEYKKLKKSLDRYSIQEYTRKQMEFFIRVDKETSMKKGWILK